MTAERAEKGGIEIITTPRVEVETVVRRTGREGGEGRLALQDWREARVRSGPAAGEKRSTDAELRIDRRRLRVVGSMTSVASF